MDATGWTRPGEATWSCRRPDAPIEENAFYRGGELLVDAGFDDPDGTVERTLARLEQLGVRARRRDDGDRRRPGRPVVIDLDGFADPLVVAGALGDDVPVAPHYLIGFTMGWFFKPGDEVQLATRHGCLTRYDDRLRGTVPVPSHERCRRVLVVDTGVAGGWPDGYPNAPTGSAEASDVCDPVHGHGTFIAGIIANIAPGAEVEVRSVSADLESFTPPKSGEEVRYTDELTVFDWLVDRAERVDAADAPDLVNMSFGTYGAMVDGRPVPPRALRRALEAVVACWPAVRIVAAIGNEAVDVDVQPFFPAAYSWGAGDPSDELRAAVVSVGALDHDGSIARWGTEDGMPRGSNRGRQVGSWVLGKDVVSAFPVAGDRLVYGSWSGTSFATAVTSGLLAAGGAPGTDPPGTTSVAPAVELHRGSLAVASPAGFESASPA